MVSRRRHFWLPGGFTGVLFALLALVSQVALGAVVLPSDAAAQEQSVAALEALSVLCVSAPTGAPDQAPPHHQHRPDCALCPLSLALAMPSAILASGPDLPPPASVLARGAVWAPVARGPPSQPRDTPPPRGPPALS